MQKGNTLVIVLVLVAVLVVGGVVAYMMTQSQNTATETTDTTTEMEAMEETVVEENDSDTTQQADIDVDTDDANVTVVNISAKNFAYSIPEIKVKKGTTVKIVLTIEAGTHDWVIDEFNARTDVVSTGQTVEVTFVADQVGEFEYYCSVGNHRQMGMVGTLVVEE